VKQSLNKLLIIPVVILATFIILALLYRALGLPSAEDFLSAARGYYQQYGLWVVFIGALAEGLLLINWYLPGSAVGVLGVVFARENDQSVIPVLAVILFGFFITSIINYVLGRYGWYQLFLRFGLEKPLNEAQQKLERVGLPLILGTYVHPNLGALTATGAGILRMHFGKFLLYVLAALAIWGTFWGAIVYYYGPHILALGTVRVIIITVVIWISYLVAKHAIELYLKRRRTK